MNVFHIPVIIIQIFLCFIQIIFCSPYHENNYCYLDVFSVTKLGPKTFDISRLNKRHWFNITYEKHGNNYELHYTFCRKSEEYPPCQNTVSLSCVTKEGKEVIDNAGASFSGFSFKDDQMQLTLHGGTGICNADKTFKTVFKFNCSKIVETPYINTQDPCSFVVLWNHPVACPIEDAKTMMSCALEQPGYRFDLRPLRKKTFFLIKQKIGKLKKKTFQLNICGHINDGTCQESSVTVCEVQGNSSIAVAYGDHSRMVLDGNLLKLQYLKNSGEVQAQIHFICDKTTLIKAPKYKGNYIFEMHTSLACLEDPTECAKFIKGNKGYSLNILHNEYKNYEVDGYKEGMKYIFNLCGPLLESKCSGLICLWDLTRNSTLSLGRRVLPLEIPQGGKDIIYHIVGGDYCPSGGTNQAKFVLKCHYMDLSPQFESLESDCTHVFLWQTPAACPYDYSEGKDCKISDHMAFHEFNFNPIRNTTGDYQVLAKSEIFTMNICGAMNQSCSTKNGSGICWRHNDSKPFVIGFYNDSRLEYLNGQISLSMDGEPCQVLGSKKSHVVITFLCEMDLNKSHLPQLLKMEIEQCFFNFVWPTPQACMPPSSSKKCDIIRGYSNNTYDLNPLMRSNSNYLVNYNRNGDHAIILLNICQPVVPEPDIKNPYDAIVYLFYTNESKTNQRYFTLGDESRGRLKFKDGLLRYESTGSFCSYSDSSNSYSTSISFTCNPECEISEPRLIEVVDYCKFKFVWETKAACSLDLKKQLIHGPISQDDQTIGCTIWSPFTNKRMDLRPLIDDYTIKTNNGTDFHFAICRNITSTKCPNVISDSYKESGACLAEISGGIANNVLHYHKSAVVLKYENGSKCSGDKTYTTTITFICNPNVPSTGPQFVDSEDKCTFYILWETSLACEREVQCVAKGQVENYTLDLSPLISNNKNYQVKIGKNTLFINVCRPLLFVHGLKCPFGSSVCLANENNSTFSKEVSFGYLTSSPVIKTDRSVWLRYDQGDSCSTDQNKNYSTAIKFICDPAVGIGQIYLQEVGRNCEYTFTWNTSYACVDKKVYFDSVRCFIYDTKDHHILNLTQFNYAIKIVSTRGSKYMLYLCKNSGKSSNILFQQIDTVWSSLGESIDTVFRYSENSTLITIKSGHKSINREKVAEVSLKCDLGHDAASSKPYIRLESAYSVFIEWKSSHFCFQEASLAAEPGTTSSNIDSKMEMTTVIPRVTKELAQLVTPSPIVPTQLTTFTVEEGSQTVLVFGMIFASIIIFMFIIVVTRYIKKKWSRVESRRNSFLMENSGFSSDVTIYPRRLPANKAGKSKII